VVAFEYISNSNQFKLLQNLSIFDQSKSGLSCPKKFEIKYGFEALEKMNNVLHRNFFRFTMNFHWKFQEFSKLNFERTLIEFLLGNFEFG
jgi:hypothetical protein